MTEQELLQEIKKSANEIQIPDSLSPESILYRTRSARPPGGHALRDARMGISKTLSAPKRPLKRLHFPAKRAFSAAAALLLCGMLSAVSYHMNLKHPAQSSSAAMEGATESLSVSSGDTLMHAGKSSEQADSSTAAAKDIAAEPKQDAGTLYTVAKSYDQIYNILESRFSQQRFYTTEKGISSSANADGAASMETSDEVTDAAAPMESADEVTDTVAEAEAKKESYSSTNLQTEGVDESDTVKTDGRYIYTLTGSKIVITDTSDGNLTRAGSVNPSLGAADRILEFYVDDHMLYVLTEHYESALTTIEPENETTYLYPDGDAVPADSSDTAGFIPLENYKLTDSVQTDFRSSTTLCSYDITDPANPVLSETASQDGYYQTSRKIGDIIYLFTQKTLAQPVSYESKTKGGVIPCVNKEEIPCDHIYVSEDGSEGLILSSFDTSDLAKPKDTIMILHSYAEIYVGTDSIYLYHSQYDQAGSLSQIAKFSIKNGIINAVNAAAVKGEIYDTFAINESGNTLRALTTYMDNSGNTDNQLYLFDENLNLTGSLTGIAKGEEIYAARYLGNTAYFITYRNTDPLFAVDLTDTSNPMLLGQLEVTGFSEYLHFWDEGKLLGLGYETDPASGNRKGLKLVMFDISNPTDLKVLDSLVLNDCHYSPGLYDYKCVLADREKNLIGFSAEYGNEYTHYYDLFTWKDGHFVQTLHETLPEYEYISYDSIRGLYIGDQFYIACPTKITGYNIKDGFQRFAELDLSE